jgi:hypothetical protein
MHALKVVLLAEPAEQGSTAREKELVGVA